MTSQPIMAIESKCMVDRQQQYQNNCGFKFGHIINHCSKIIKVKYLKQYTNDGDILYFYIKWVSFQKNRYISLCKMSNLTIIFAMSRIYKRIGHLAMWKK